MNILAATARIKAAAAELKQFNDLCDKREALQARATFISQQITINAVKRIPLIAVLNRSETEQAQLDLLTDEYHALRAAAAEVRDNISLINLILNPAAPRAPAKPFDLSRSMGYGTGRYQGD